MRHEQDVAFAMPPFWAFVDLALSNMVNMHCNAEVFQPLSHRDYHNLLLGKAAMTKTIILQNACMKCARRFWHMHSIGALYGQDIAMSCL